MMYVVEFSQYDTDPGDDPVPEPVYFTDVTAAYKFTTLKRFNKDDGLYGYFITLYELCENKDGSHLPLVKSDPIIIDMEKIVELMFNKLDLADIKTCVEIAEAE